MSMLELHDVCPVWHLLKYICCVILLSDDGCCSWDVHVELKVEVIDGTDKHLGLGLSFEDRQQEVISDAS